MTNVAEPIATEHRTTRVVVDSSEYAAPVSKAALWAGRIIGALAVLMLTFSGIMKLVKAAPVVEEFTRLGYADGHALGIGILELACVVLYAIPRTAVLGAVLLTGYLGGAVATHVRVGDQFVSPIIIGVVVWLALFLRDRRLRALLPLRRAGNVS